MCVCVCVCAKCVKNIGTKAEADWNKLWMTHDFFLKIAHAAFNSFPASFPLVQASLIFLFQYGVKLCRCVFYVLYVLRYYLWNKFSV